MILGQEFLEDYRFEADYPFGLPCDFWRTGDGTLILIKEMTVQHIKNCMKIVGEDDGWYKAFRSELSRRGGTP